MGTRITHRVAEARSLTLHREVARRLLEDPELVAAARARVVTWLEDGTVPRRWAERWLAILEAPVEGIASAITEDSEPAASLRQVSPFAGALDARTRWSLLRRQLDGVETR